MALRNEADRGEPRLITVGALRVDLRARAVTLAGHSVELRRREFDLLAHLAAEPRRVFGRRELLAGVWGYHTVVSTRTLDSHASRLRIKLAAGAPATRSGIPARWVVAVRGVGYRLI